MNPLKPNEMRAWLNKEGATPKTGIYKWFYAFVGRDEHAHTCNAWPHDYDHMGIEREHCDCGLESARLLVKAMGEK